MGKGDRKESQVTFWEDSEFLLEYDLEVTRSEYSTRAAAIRAAIRKQLMEWKRKR
ncbi:hypothetical protein MUP01_12005 [Candidatus Bathyarchaeota archaeon]|nr:hypothetical protein [Candidatus Bathyarchaeota archaeon]